MLTLRDPQSSKTHAIPPEGATIGREGGRADILVRNPSVSKEHARLFSAEGAWWLEDLGSANGTYVNNGRISEPTQLTAGLIFALSSYKFEVASIGEEHVPEPARRPGMPAGPAAGAAAGANRPGARAMMPTENGPAFDPVAVARAKPAAAPPPTPARANPQVAPPRTRSGAIRPKAVSPQPESGDDAEAFAATSAALPKSRSGVRPPPDAEPSEPSEPSQRSGEQPMSSESYDSSMGQLSTTNVMRELPKAIAYYMATVPKLLFNPLGTIRNSIEDQRFPGMKGVPLIGWALPGLAAFGAVGLLSTLVVVIVGAVRGAGFAFGALIGGIIVTVAVGVIGGLVTAFLFHPVTEFLIRLLKGESDEKSRTNSLIIGQAAIVLFAVPGAINSLVVAFAALIPIAAVGALLTILPQVLQLGATLIMLAVAYLWSKFFKVHKVIPLIILILGALAALGTVWGMIGSVRVAIASIGSGGSGSSARVVVNEAEARAAAAKMLDSADVQKAVRDTKKATAAAAAETEKAEKAAEKAAAAEPTPPPRETHVAEVAAHDAPPPTTTPPTTAPPSEPSLPSPGVAGLTPYQRYAQKREQIDKIIAADPTILTKNDEVLGLYKKIDSIQRNISKGRKAEDLVARRLNEAETFERTAKLVDDLYQRLTK